MIDKWEIEWSDKKKKKQRDGVDGDIKDQTKSQVSEKWVVQKQRGLIKI